MARRKHQLTVRSLQGTKHTTRTDGRHGRESEGAHHGRESEGAHHGDDLPTRV
jgi:hypothetical protein